MLVYQRVYGCIPGVFSRPVGWSLRPAPGELSRDLWVSRMFSTWALGKYVMANDHYFSGIVRFHLFFGWLLLNSSEPLESRSSLRPLSLDHTLASDYDRYTVGILQFSWLESPLPVLNLNHLKSGLCLSKSHALV